MKSFGLLLLIIGGIGALLAFNMNTTVSTESQHIGGIYIPSQTVNNIGLMDERRNYLMISGLLFIVGIIMFVFGNRGEQDNAQTKQVQIATAPPGDNRTCPYCAETVKKEAIVCRFCHKDLPPIDVDKEKATKEATTFMSNLSETDKIRMEKLIAMTAEERRKECFACRGEGASCGMCDATEAKLQSYIKAKKNITA